MAASGILGEYKGSQAREVMMTIKEYEQIRKQAEAAEKQAVASILDTGKENQPYETSNEGEYHYAAVEDQD